MYSFFTQAAKFADEWYIYLLIIVSDSFITWAMLFDSIFLDSLLLFIITHKFNKH